MAKWEPEDLSALDLRIIIERLRGMYRNNGVPVSYQPSRIELEAARRLELVCNLLLSEITTDLVLEMAKVAYEAASKECNDFDWPWDDAALSYRAAWVTGTAAGIVKFLNSLQEGGVAHGIMGKQNRDVSSHGTESAVTDSDMPAQPLTGL